MSELIPCQRCGGQPTLIERPEMKMYCERCNRYTRAGRDEGDAVDNWNEYMLMMMDDPDLAW